MSDSPNHRTFAEFYIRGLTDGSVTAAEVIAWADEVIVAASKTEDWMLDISTSNADDRMGVLHHLHAVQGQVDEAALSVLLAAKK
jgi:MoxR-like ATPase